ncbi:hypothetical protein JCM19239_5921 [Vibrio variabilis]|uniref:Uncharacterized protein n=1 Tax=Vibrio variabilis TaxID=990271 RepID=A0ABQ0J8K3_9VIBR|nr:hypothetical protein JCM19239_5921 [Vibrio variabilis]
MHVFNAAMGGGVITQLVDDALNQDLMLTKQAIFIDTVGGRRDFVDHSVAFRMIHIQHGGSY